MGLALVGSCCFDEAGYDRMACGVHMGYAVAAPVAMVPRSADGRAGLLGAAGES